jgi:hypothetical protein
MNKNIMEDDLIAYSLPDFIYNFPEVAHFKESKNFTYQISNQANLDVYSLERETQIVGKTIFDLKKEIMTNKWPDALVQEIHRADLRVVKEKKTLHLNHTSFLNQTGYVVVHSIVKSPIFDNEKNVSGILTMGFDVTQSENVTEIRQRYLNFYADKAEANLQFMKHINFHEGIKLKCSLREIDCLLCLLKYRSSKTASHFLDITVKTLENHLCRIREKAEGYYTIKGLLEILAARINRI